MNLFLANFPRRLPAVLSPFSCDLVLMAHAARISCPSSRIHRSGRVVRIGSSLLSPRGCSRNFSGFLPEQNRWNTQNDGGKVPRVGLRETPSRAWRACARSASSAVTPPACIAVHRDALEPRWNRTRPVTRSTFTASARPRRERGRLLRRDVVRSGVRPNPVPASSAYLRLLVARVVPASSALSLACRLLFALNGPRLVARWEVGMRRIPELAARLVARSFARARSSQSSLMRLIPALVTL